VARDEREDSGPQTHYGIIASGNAVIIYGGTRHETAPVFIQGMYHPGPSADGDRTLFVFSEDLTVFLSRPGM
jgi:hypothetical protein